MIYADLHVHIGRSLNGRAVKITAADSLTLPHVLQVARNIKGLKMIGIIDSHSIGVKEDFKLLLLKNEIKPLEGGGYSYGPLVIIPGTEVELKIGNGNAHFLAYFPNLEYLESYSRRIYSWVKNWQLGSQKVHAPAENWFEAVQLEQGFWMPAHVFTPHKGIYGNCCNSLKECLVDLPKAIELGLSADSSMANMISELENTTFFSNSDAHSLSKIAREFNLLKMGDFSYTGLKHLIEKKDGKVLKNYGIPPEMGKYHRSYCPECREIIITNEPACSCPTCHNPKIILGVYDRVVMISDKEYIKDSSYIYHIPLRELPGIGLKTYERLLNLYGNEIEILHEVPLDDLYKTVGEQIAYNISQMRKGMIKFKPGGGGIYGKIIMH